MAERRMFAKTIIDSDAFLDMPTSSQALYFHLSMRADDDGFINNPKKIQRMINCSDDDLKLLIAKKFLFPFDSGVVVIKHWRIHNYIRGDRKKETVYVEEMALLDEKDNGAYTLKNETDVIEKPMLIEENETPRQKAYKESNLPYSFEYKIKEVFKGKPCPCCGFKMQENIEDGIKTSNRIPSIQHNIPISKGGKHELGNISIICKECNVTLQDTETGELNAQEVIEAWDKICQTNDRQVTDKCQHRLGKDRIELGKDRIELNNLRVPYSDIVDLYNEICVSLPKVKAITDSRKDKIKTRWKELGCIETFEALFYRAEQSDFLCGRSSKWKCSFDWLMENDKNYLKVIEGNYDNDLPKTEQTINNLRDWGNDDE